MSRPMDEATIPLADDFPAPDEAAWRALVDKTLNGADFEKRLVSRTADGIAVQPLYRPWEGSPLLEARPQVSADVHRPWDPRARVDHPDPARANADLLVELEGGAQSALISLDPSGRSGVAAADRDGFARLTEGVLLDLAPVALDAGWRGADAADWAAAAAKGAPFAPLAFHMDPIGALAERGPGPSPVGEAIASAARTGAGHAETYARASLFLASGRAVHEAGGTEAQELGFAAACAIAYARALVEAGLPMQEAFGRIVLGLAADGEYFTTIAKLRAARAIWARLTGACGVSAPAVIEARSSRRMLSRLDPWVNMLRLTAAGFGAGVGGADAVVLDAFTQPLCEAGDARPTAFARRQARNTQLILMEEAYLGRVSDPAGGSAFLETLTDQLARAGWAAFQRIEAAGDAVAALEDASLAAQVARARTAREADVARRKAGLIGASEFPNLHEAPVEVEAVDLTAFAASGGGSPLLPPWRAAEPFERLRARAAAMHPRPKVWLATLGTLADFSLRVGFARDLFAAGGIEAEVGSVEAYDPQAFPLACVCGSDRLYAEQGEAAARALKAAGARRIMLAGRPGDLEATMNSAGVDGYLVAGGDALQALTAALNAVED